MIFGRIRRRTVKSKKRRRSNECLLFVLALPIFPGRLQPSIVGRSELNFRVRDGNGWTLALINTNYIRLAPSKPNNVKLEAPLKALPASFVGQALGLLVPISCTHYCASTFGLSTRSSFWVLTPYRMRDLILGGVSRLDAFSVYLVRT